MTAAVANHSWVGPQTSKTTKANAGAQSSALSPARFAELAGTVSGHLFVKIVVDRRMGQTHFIDHHQHQFHADYIGEEILGRAAGEIDQELDRFNESLYFDVARRFLVAILSRHTRDGDTLFALETVEVDTMDRELLSELFHSVDSSMEEGLDVYLKPSNHQQEQYFRAEDALQIPAVWANELYELSDFLALNLGSAEGRLRVFENEADYRAAHATLGMRDILVMPRIPDDVPRVAGFINAEHTTPLSHSNILAHGWQIPNAVQRGIMARVDDEQLRDQWVTYTVEAGGEEVALQPLSTQLIPEVTSPAVPKVSLERPGLDRAPIRRLTRLRMTDRYRYGTKAANLGELQTVLESGSSRLLGFYRIPRPPRQDLLQHLARYLGVPNDDRLPDATLRFVQQNLRIPRGIAIPFVFQKQFLASSPRIQQHIGRLKMALDLDAEIVPQLCEELREMILAHRIPDDVQNYIDNEIVRTMSGTASFVVRSSSNAEDLDNFSAAGIYESVNHVTTDEELFHSIKKVWASLIVARSVKLRHAAGIPLDDAYMGVIIQEEVQGDLGGVLVTTNPTVPGGGFRDVFMNASRISVQDVVSGEHAPFQMLFNTVEGGGRTLSVGKNQSDLTATESDMLQRLAFASRILQSHFSRDYTFATPLDIEWILSGDKVYLLQARPYAQS